MTTVTEERTRTLSGFFRALVLPLFFCIFEYVVLVSVERFGLISIEWTQFRVGIIFCVCTVFMTAYHYANDIKCHTFFIVLGILISWLIAGISFLLYLFIYFDLSFLTGRKIQYFMYLGFLLQVFFAQIKDQLRT